MTSKLEALLAERRPLVMGVVNVTPDSFSDGGRYLKVDAAVKRALSMVEEKVDIVDVGGESTRPGAKPVSEEIELKRVVPVIKKIREESEVCISVDTSTPEVMRQAALVGCDVINDVRSLTREGALDAAAESGLAVCLMHMKGEPSQMQNNPTYENLIDEIRDFFRERISACDHAGIKRKQLLIDPGFGFGKTALHNLELVNRLRHFKSFGLPILIGVSRKSTIKKILGGNNDNLKIASVAAALIASLNGADVLRVHDVTETVAALRVAQSIVEESIF
ncbi:MAG: dihydropteroate synthase [Pseudomonadota bacterium]|nr:dihydropteroate synthase [Pseudomonadota bacterium]